MKYSYTLTKKGQFTLPKEARKALGLKPLSRISVFFDRTKQMIQIEPVKDILDLAGTVKSKNFDPMRLRENFEKNYERK